MASATASEGASKASNISWLFVPQYYSCLNQSPSRLHCFYTKRSTLIHSVEGDEATAHHGQQEIHAKIMSLAFDDCKVFISNLDSQSSADGAILIQVIGDISNKGGPWRKFAQTFFLAEQPSGYFVLNDIFRYIKEDADDMDDVLSLPDPVPPVPVEELTIEHAPAELVNGAHLHEDSAATEPLIPASPATQTTEEVHTEEPSLQTADTSLTPSEPEPQEPEPTPQPTVPEPAATPSSPVPPSTPLEPTQSPSQPKSPQPSKAPAGKTWASLAANVSQKPGGFSAPPTRAPSNPSGVPSSASSVAGSSPNLASNPACFVRGIHGDNFPERLLRDVLSSRYGPIAKYDFIKSKHMAFVEFVSRDSAQRAIQASRPLNVGGEGGIKFTGNEGTWTVWLEEKRSAQATGIYTHPAPQPKPQKAPQPPPKTQPPPQKQAPPQQKAQGQQQTATQKAGKAKR